MIWSAMSIRDTLVLYCAAAAFVAGVLILRYVIAPAIVQHGGLTGTLAALAAMYFAGVWLDRQ